MQRVSQKISDKMVVQLLVDTFSNECRVTTTLQGGSTDDGTILSHKHLVLLTNLTPFFSDTLYVCKF